MDNPLARLRTFRKIQDLDLKGKKVLVRVDFNVPLKADGSISDDTRIRESIPTIQHILNAGGKVILMSHLGRPKGKKSSQYSLAPCAKALSTLLDQTVSIASDCIGPEVKKMADNLKEGEILLLENLRFYEAEEKPALDPNFAKQLAGLGDIYINDAFGTAHREHSSTATIATFFPNRSAAGLLLQREISFLEQLIVDPKPPFYAIIGGSKISTKIGVLTALASKTQGIFIGGAMALTFFKAKGIAIGSSLCEEDQVPTALAFLEECTRKQISIFLPKDIVIADAFTADAQSETIEVAKGIPDHWRGMDIGPKTIEDWSHQLKSAATIFWNGPLGVFEFPRFAKGTEEIARCLAGLGEDVTTVIGGGDSVAAINQLHLGDQFSHLSTGGGASLELIEFGHLPGIDALCNDKSNN